MEEKPLPTGGVEIPRVRCRPHLRRGQVESCGIFHEWVVHVDDCPYCHRPHIHGAGLDGQAPGGYIAYDPEEPGGWVNLLGMKYAPCNPRQSYKLIPPDPSGALALKVMQLELDAAEEEARRALQ